MAEITPENKSVTEPLPSPVPVKVIGEIPTIFADAVSNHVMGPGIVKFYMHRFDPDPENSNETSKSYVAQIIMPAKSFVDMVAFFELRLRMMVTAGYVDQDFVDAQKAIYSDVPPNA